jgi:hypothetical protein
VRLLERGRPIRRPGTPVTSRPTRGWASPTSSTDERQGPAKTPAEYPGDGAAVHYDEGVLVGYRWYDAKGEKPLFPFGHGLSYTTFR